jgi:tRNA pseudouridine38-40 synthase
VRVRASGRTDAGVHALGQVVSIEEADDLHPDVVHRSMPGLLPPDVAVLDAQPAVEGFDARRSARSRSYVYLLWCADAPHPLYRKYAVWPRQSIDTVLLAEALQAVVGTHDFSSFARVREEQTPVRTILEASAITDGPFVRIKLVGESFLHQMVRSITGTALEIASGRRPISWMKEALEAGRRSAAGPVAPAHGLTLVDVGYDDAPWARRPAVTWPWSGLAYTREHLRGCA